MGVRKRSAAEMEARAKKGKEDEDAAKRYRRALEDQKRMAELGAEEEEEEGGYEPTTDVEVSGDEVVSSGVLLPGEGPVPDTPAVGVLLPGEGPVPDTPAADLRPDQKPARSSNNSNYSGR